MGRAGDAGSMGCAGDAGSMGRAGESIQMSLLLHASSSKLSFLPINHIFYCKLL